MSTDEPRYDRRNSDRHLAAVSERLAVLTQRVDGFEQRVADLLKTADATHDRLHAGIRSLEARLDRVDEVVITANLAKIPERVEKLEDDAAARLGLREGVLRLVGPYGGFLIGLAGVLYAIFTAH